MHQNFSFPAEKEAQKVRQDLIDDFRIGGHLPVKDIPTSKAPYTDVTEYLLGCYRGPSPRPMNIRNAAIFQQMLYLRYHQVIQYHAL